MLITAWCGLELSKPGCEDTKSPLDTTLAFPSASYLQYTVKPEVGLFVATVLWYNLFLVWLRTGSGLFSSSLVASILNELRLSLLNFASVLSSCGPMFSPSSLAFLFFNRPVIVAKNLRALFLLVSSKAVSVDGIVEHPVFFSLQL